MPSLIEMLKALNLKQMNVDLDRLISGQFLDSTNKPYTINYISKMIKFFERGEEYEKCGKLLKVKNDLLDHESNYCGNTK